MSPCICNKKNTSCVGYRSLPETRSLPVKMVGWKTIIFPLGAKCLFSGLLSLLLSGKVHPQKTNTLTNVPLKKGQPFNRKYIDWKPWTFRGHSFVFREGIPFSFGPFPEFSVTLDSDWQVYRADHRSRQASVPWIHALPCVPLDFYPRHTRKQSLPNNFFT